MEEKSKGTQKDKDLLAAESGILNSAEQYKKLHESGQKKEADAALRDIIAGIDTVDALRRNEIPDKVYHLYIDYRKKGSVALANIIKAARVSRNLTLDLFQTLTGVSSDDLNDIERAEAVTIKLETLKKLQSYTDYLAEDLGLILQEEYRATEQIKLQEMNEVLVRLSNLPDSISPRNENPAELSSAYFYSSIKSALFVILNNWCRGKGRIRSDWGVLLERNNKDWVPTPALTYVSYDRLPRQWRRNGFCPVPCTLAIEIATSSETLPELEEAAINYLEAGCDRAWILDVEKRRLIMHGADEYGEYYQTSDRDIEDKLLPGLKLSVDSLWKEAEL